MAGLRETIHNNQDRSGGGIHGPLLCVIQLGQCVCLDVLGTWSVREGKHKTGDKHGSPCLTRIQSPHCPDVLQIAVVSTDEKGVFSPLKPMSPHLQSFNDSQQLQVPHIIVSLRRAELLREESTGAEFQWRTRALREHSSYPSLGGVHLHYEDQRGIRMRQHRSRGKHSLQVPKKSPSAPADHWERTRLPFSIEVMGAAT